MSLHYHKKTQLKWSRQSWDIQIWKIGQSDWLILFCRTTWEPVFCWTCGFHKMMRNHGMYHLKTKNMTFNDQIFGYSPKTSFFTQFGPFCPNFGKTRFFQKNSKPSLFLLYDFLISYKKSEKTIEPILRYCITEVWTYRPNAIGHFCQGGCPINEFFPLFLSYIFLPPGWFLIFTT